MIKWLKKIDSVVTVLVLTIVIGVCVVTLRSQTYYVGYDIAKLKSQEKSLRKQNTELQIELSKLQRNIRAKLLSEKNAVGNKKMVFPDTAHVIVEEENHGT